MPSSFEKDSGKLIGIGLVLFVLALALRVLFLQATADAQGPYSPYYKGDTPVWLDYARAIQLSQPFQLGLPLRPPGVGYLVALAWDGQQDGFESLKLTWALFGAVLVVVFYAALLRPFGLRVAVTASFIMAASTAMMVLSTSPNNEIPYLLLVISSLVFWQSVRHRPGILSLLPWAALNGLACLIRAEHVLFFALVSLYLVLAWTDLPAQKASLKQVVGWSLMTLAFFIIPLVPWHTYAWTQIDQFNRQPMQTNRATEQVFVQLEQLLSQFPWSDSAKRAREELPVFVQRPMGNFVAATVAYRGGSEVSAEDFQLIEDAFGSRPEPLHAYPFITVYGALNFYLANNQMATGGFTRTALEIPPPLKGGASAYPGFLIAGLPPPELALSYPPHLEAVNHGYRLGWKWILDNPSAYLLLVVSKVQIFWSGVAMGFTGYNLPLGISGSRGAVDLVVPDPGRGVFLWRFVGAIILVAGIWLGRRNEALVPWLMLLVTKTITSLAFFGYAREGAVVLPVFALLAGLVLIHGLDQFSKIRGRDFASPNPMRWLQLSCFLAFILVATEAYRWNSIPVIFMDGQEVGIVEPFPQANYQTRKIEVRTR